MNTRLAFLGILAFLALPRCFASTFQITSFALTKPGSSSANPYNPMAGETYEVYVQWDQMGKGAKSYDVAVNMAGTIKTFNASNLGPGQGYHVWQDFNIPLDGQIPVVVTIDPKGAAGAGHAGPTKTITFTPTPPSKAIDYFDPVTLQGTQSVTYSFSNFNQFNFTVMMGQPTTGGWQKVVDASGSIATPPTGSNLAALKTTGTVYKYPVYCFSGSNEHAETATFSQRFTVEVSSQRVNPDKLRQVTWAAMDALQSKPELHYFTQPEKVIQSNDPAIRSFIVDALGPNWRSRFTPYDAARTVFQAVLRRCSYYTPKPGQPDKRPTTALDMLKQHFGDCGGFSILLVACYRNMGIPARCACGAWVGEDAGHCWCETFFPGDGWFVSDGAMGDGACPTGQYAYYFGCIPDLNARYATMRGNTFQRGVASTSWLQGPMWPIVLNGATLSDAVCHTTVTEVQGSAAGKAMRATAHTKLPKWDLHSLMKNVKAYLDH